MSSPLSSPTSRRSPTSLSTPSTTPSPSQPLKSNRGAPPSSAKAHATSTHVRSPSMNGARKVPLVGSRGTGAETSAELVKASREVLIELAGRAKRELAEALERSERLEESSARAVGERIQLEGEFERAKGKINELMVSEGRMEEELAGRIEVLDKLRSSVRELEREKRESEKRYREQAESFDSERQSWYDQEQHYKLRLSTTPRKPRLSDLPKPSLASDSDNDFFPRPHPESPTARSAAPYPSPSGPTAIEAALQDQLSSLTTAHDSLTTTLRALQVELGELKRVYQDLQEENESYEVLLGQKTLNGEIGTLFRRSWGSSEGDSFASGQPGAALESVGESDEVEEEEEEVDVEKILLETQGIGSPNSGAVQAGTTSGGKKKTRKSTGGGLDLAAELEAAQWADEEEEPPVKALRKHKREATSEDAMRNEIRHLREANKALTLYVSKIVDRVCSQEGFEKVLAVDYKQPPNPIVPTTLSPSLPPPPSDLPPPRQRPSSTYFHRGSATSSNGTREPPSTTSPPLPPPSTSSDRRRKTMSLGWDSVSWLGSAFAAPVSPALPAQPAGFKPLMLGTTAVPESAGRKLETEEDEEDRRERERLRAEMALLGISEPGTAWTQSFQPVEGGKTPFRRSPLPSGDEGEEEARKVMERLDRKEREAKAELEQGRASGFTEPKTRRQRPERSRSGSSQGGSAIGLGIQSEAGVVGGGAVEEVEKVEEPSGWGKKALRRVSLGWSSPVVG